MPTDVLSAVLFTALALPPCDLADRYRFPPQEAAAANLRVARARLAWIDSHTPLWRHQYEWHFLARRHAKWRYDCWDWLNAAQGGEGRGPDYWRYSLGRLRELIGEEAYRRGTMPPPDP